MKSCVLKVCLCSAVKPAECIPSPCPVPTSGGMAGARPAPLVDIARMLKLNGLEWSGKGRMSMVRRHVTSNFYC